MAGLGKISGEISKMAKKIVKKAKKKTAKRTNPAVAQRARRARRARRRRSPRYQLPTFTLRNPTPRPSPMDEIMPLITMLMEKTSAGEDKAKKILECAELFDNTDKEFAAALRDRARELLRPSLGPVAQIIEPAIRKLDID